MFPCADLISSGSHHLVLLPLSNMHHNRIRCAEPSPRTTYITPRTAFTGNPTLQSIIVLTGHKSAPIYTAEVPLYQPTTPGMENETQRQAPGAWRILLNACCSFSPAHHTPDQLLISPRPPSHLKPQPARHHTVRHHSVPACMQCKPVSLPIMVLCQNSRIGPGSTGGKT